MNDDKIIMDKVDLLVYMASMFGAGFVLAYLIFS